MRFTAWPCLVLSFLAMLAFLAMSKSAEAADPVVTAVKVEGRTPITVGDHFNIIITVEAESGTQVLFAPGALPAAVSLIRQPAVTSKDKGRGKAEITLAAEVAAFFVGDAQLPPIRLNYQDRNGAGGQIATAATRLIVASTIPESGDVEARPLKPQAEIPAGGTQIWAEAAGLALLGASVLGIAVLRRLRRGRLRHESAPAEPEAGAAPIGPEDRARQELDRTAVDDLAERNFPAYYAVLSATVRRYLTDRFDFPAFALTTMELQDRMVAHGIDRWQARLAGGLLEQCDAVVFAGYRPAPDRADSDLTAAYEIVEISRPEEAEKEAPV